MASAYEKRCLKRARDIIPSNPYAVQELSQWIKGTVHHIDNPADDRFFALADEAEPERVLLPARVMPRKNVLWLVQAWAEVVASFPGARLRVAGEVHTHPGYVERVRRFVEGHELQENVDLLGSLDQEQLLEEYARCSLVVLPSVQETSPLVVVEALSAGRPVVATRICGLPFLVSDGDTGLLVELGDTEGMAQALIRLLDDDELRQRMGRRAREDAEGRFKIDVVARQTYEVYRKVMEKVGL
jgi:glycosyltransferase involved in cell wall biosynthesis